LRSVGAATLELALVLPLLVAMILYGLYLAQLAQAKLEVQEAARRAAWEMTGYVLSDYGQGKHDLAFDAASASILKEAAQHGPAGGWVADYGTLQLQLTNERAALAPVQLPQMGGSGDLAAKVSAAAGSLRALMDTWALNAKGQARAEVQMDVASKLLPDGVLRERLQSTHVLLADGWQLVDGADSVAENGRAGNHPNGGGESGLHHQVARMTFVGIRSALDRMPGAEAALSALGNVGLPAFTGTFVVSHNYLANGLDRGCYAWGVDTTSNPAPSGLNNVGSDGGLDWPHPRCFDTAPFRDVEQYDRSLYVQMFKARGPYFMGCQNAQADDPTSARSANDSDVSQDHTPCTQ
jgi:hypothetical protein